MARIDPKQIQQAGASTNDVLTWDGSEWVPTTPSGGGGGWTDDGTTVRLTTAGDEVSIGSDTALANTKLSVYADSATQKPIAIKLAATPTADAIEIQDSTGTKLFGLTAGCNVIHIPNNSGGLAISDSGVSGLGTSSTAIGYLSDAIGNNCVAVGNGAQAGSTPGGSFRFSVAMGYNASALFSSCVVIGYNASAASSSSVVVGATASAASNGVSIGWAAVASANSVVIGESASGSGATNLVAIGKGASASTAGVAIGLNASSVGGIAIGEGAVSSTSHCVIGKASAGKIGIYTLGATYLGVASPQVITLRPEPVVTGTTDTAGASFTIQGGQSTGTGVGGSIIFQTTPAGGTGSAQNSYSTILTLTGDSKIGFFGVTPVVKQADIGALTDSTGGTADNTVAAVSGSGADTTINNNFADLIDQINQLRTTLRNYGLMA